MGWTAYYQILRERPLEEDEVVTLHDFIRETNRTPWEGEDFGLAVTRDARPDHVLAHGMQKFPLADESEDQERLCGVLTALSRLIDDIEVRVEDDFECFGWDDENGEAAMDGPTTSLVSLRDYDAFVDPAKLVGPRPAALPKAVATLARGGKPSRKTVAAALVEHANMSANDPQHEPLTKALSTTPALMRVQAGLDVFASLTGKLETLQLMGAAPLAPEEVASVVDDFLAMWRSPRGVYWYEQLLRAVGDQNLDAVARVPEVEKEMRSDLRVAREEDAPDLTYRRAQAAAEMLGRAGTRHALLALLETAYEIQPLSDRAASKSVLPGIVAALLRFEDLEIVPMLVHEVVNGTRASHHRGAALQKLARVAPSRAMPLAEHMATTGEATWSTIDALQSIGDEAAIAALRRLCELPDVQERERAAAALRALGVEPPAFPEIPPPEVLVTHVNRDVRYAALRTLDERADPATLLSFLLAAELDNELAKRFDTPRWSWKMRELLPEAIRKQSFTRQVTWLRGRNGLVWPSVERVLADGARAVALTYPSPWPTTNVTSAGDVRDEASVVIHALRTELGLVKPRSPPAVNVGALFDPTPVVRTPVVPMPFPKDPAPKPQPAADVIDELLAVLDKEQVPSADLIERAGLSRDIAQSNAWDACKQVVAHLTKKSPEELTARLIATLPAYNRGLAVRDVCAYAFPQTIGQPGIAEALLELWERAFTTPWEYTSRATDCLLSVASHPTIFARMIDEIAAPDDGPLRNRTTGAFELLAAAVERRSEALSAIVARMRRDRGRPRDVIEWRGDAMRSLRKLGMEDGVPTAILELAELASIGRANEVFELLAAHPSGLGALRQAVDLRNGSRDAVRELCRSPHIDEGLRREYSEHPFWKVRLVAAEANRDWEQSGLEVAAIWAAIDAAGLPVTNEERSSRPARVPKLTAAQRSLPLPREGMAASCFDYRAWSLWAVDQLADPSDAAARVFADELDIAMVERGHARIAPRWHLWRAKVPTLPLDRRGRLEWARAQTSASLPPMIARVRDEGARDVAAELASPHLVLPPELRQELEDRERQVAEAGEALFTCT